MSRFHLAQRIEEERLFEEEQEKLKKKYEIKEPEVVVVEKSNIYKFTVRILVGIVKATATILLLGLALIGIATLVYPAPRAAMEQVFQEIWSQLVQMLI